MSIKSDLRKLRVRRAGADYLGEYYAQIDAERNDRGAAILAATFLENGLEFAVSRRLPGSARLHEALFENQCPASSLDAKILLANALEIIGPLTVSNLDIIKHVRNTFAHSSIPISFETAEVAAACNALNMPSVNPQWYRKSLKFEMPREKYSTICETTGAALLNYAASCVNTRSELIAARYPGEFFPVPPPPLP